VLRNMAIYLEILRRAGVGLDPLLVRRAPSVAVHFLSLPVRCAMSSDADSIPPERDGRAAGSPPARDDGSSDRGIPLTTIGLCGLAMILVGSGMRRAASDGWWVWPALAGVLILILHMWMKQERWLTRERHRLTLSALKRTGASGRSGPSEEKTSRRTRARRGGKPVESGSSRSGKAQPPRLGDGAVPPDPPRPRDGETVRGKATPEQPDEDGRP
jgi:hypothetical protein